MKTTIEVTRFIVVLILLLLTYRIMGGACVVSLGFRCGWLAETLIGVVAVHIGSLAILGALLILDWVDGDSP